MGISIFFSQKGPATYGDFDFFFLKIPPIFKLEVGFFSAKKKFSQIFQNTAHFFHPNFISKTKKKKTETFLIGRAGGRSLTHSLSKYPRFWKLKLDFFPLKKVFRRFPKYRHIYSI